MSPCEAGIVDACLDLHGTSDWLVLALILIVTIRAGDIWDFIRYGRGGK